MNVTAGMCRREEQLPLAVLCSYLFFLMRRPVSESNRDYLTKRIAGLRALQRYFSAQPLAPIREACQRLSSLTPPSFHIVAPALHALLAPYNEELDECPAGFLHSYGSPPRPFFSPVRRALLICGPGIGVGDEIMLFRIPLWLRRRFPRMRIETLSAYHGLWDRVRDIDAADVYEGYDSLVDHVRCDSYDLIIMADFERPRLYRALYGSARPGRYIELSTGTGTAVIVDQHQKVIYRNPPHAPYFANFYHGLCALMRWMGFAAEPDEGYSAVLDVRRETGDRTFTLFVSPFTSKYDPSMQYWKNTLLKLCEYVPRILLDSGPNLTTERFAAGLRSAVVGAYASVNIDLCRSDGRRTISLSDAIYAMSQAHAVLCTDSYAAHAAPLTGCTTCVIARRGLERWRVPYPGNFYLRAEDPLEDVVQAIITVLSLQKAGGSEEARLSAHPERLLASIGSLKTTLDSGRVPHTKQLTRCFRRFLDARRKNALFVTAQRDVVPALFHDALYEYTAADSAIPKWPSDIPIADAVAHIRNRVYLWENTNGFKFMCGERGSQHGSR
jgi:hypothetical protein